MRKILVTVVILGNSAVAMWSAPSPEEKPPVKPLVAISGEHSKIVKEKLLRITTEDDWNALLKEHGEQAWQGCVELNFNKVMVIAVFEGKRAQCRGYKANEIIEDGDKIILRIHAMNYQVGSDGKADSSEGWGIFVVPRSNKKVILERDVQDLLGDAPPIWKEWKKFPAISDKP